MKSEKTEIQLEAALKTVQNNRLVLEQIITYYEKKLADQAVALDYKNTQLDKAKTELDLVYNSISWKITNPLRKIKKYVKL